MGKAPGRGSPGSHGGSQRRGCHGAWEPSRVLDPAGMDPHPQGPLVSLFLQADCNHLLGGAWQPESQGKGKGMSVRRGCSWREQENPMGVCWWGGASQDRAGPASDENLLMKWGRNQPCLAQICCPQAMVLEPAGRKHRKKSMGFYCVCPGPGTVWGASLVFRFGDFPVGEK